MRGTRVALVLAALLSGCVVERPNTIDDGYFACTSPSDCGEGQACAEGNVYAPDFCRPACDQDDPSTCPGGVCTARGACLEGCRFLADGSDSGCPNDFTCVRIDAVDQEGVCWPVKGCSRSDECDTATEQCLNDALGLGNPNPALRFDNLYCTARPDAAMRCPEGYLAFQVPTSQDLGGTETVCYPPCDTDGSTLCPPATTCFGPFGDLFTGTPDTPPCFPGFFGLPCEDDTHCLLGRCLLVGDGHRACTQTCEAATRDFGGCEQLEGGGEGLAVFSRMRCDDVGGTPTCVPRYDLGSVCDDNLSCVTSDAACSTVMAGTVETHVCVRSCDGDDDCWPDTGGLPSEYRCANRICVRRRRNGSRCASDQDCVSTHCCRVGTTALSACRDACVSGPG
ncbi:MAG: hypothetical protein AB7S26_18400 [Sandaracinaceae bacterium]